MEQGLLNSQFKSVELVVDENVTHASFVDECLFQRQLHGFVYACERYEEVSKGGLTWRVGAIFSGKRYIARDFDK
jgi:hypothetical protein